MLAGVAGLLLPRLAGVPLHPDRLHRWVRPGKPQADDEPPTAPTPASTTIPPALVQDHSVGDDRPPLVDDLVR
jgi:hypothetical protein